MYDGMLFIYMCFRSEGTANTLHGYLEDESKPLNSEEESDFNPGVRVASSTTLKGYPLRAIYPGVTGSDVPALLGGPPAEVPQRRGYPVLRRARPGRSSDGGEQTVSDGSRAGWATGAGRQREVTDGRDFPWELESHVDNRISR